MTSNASQPLVIVLLGPTASGKTDLAIKIAEKLKVGIINIDSRQLYIGMDIGTAKPTPAQQKAIPHHLLDLRYPNNPINLQEFQQTATAHIEKEIQTNEMSLLVGGSGLYLKAITKGLCPPAVPPQTSLRAQLSQLGQEASHQLLKQVDPTAASRISTSDFVRTQRALEVFYATGKPISSQQAINPPSWRILELGLDPVNLRQRISKRTKEIYLNGLIEETERLIQIYSKDLPLLQTIGYKEALQVINGSLDLDEAIETTTKRTNQFSKRQRTWFKGQHNPHWLNHEKPLRESLSIIQAGLGWD
ncbi:tRNA (adenosine(37)-N6)-dimethylallyltransferase MiaA [Prochlorococcus sp. MIT 1300]|uniref:tRNA (adenosine(37)-N6)-dimethylallyltransferase MiaA n=1 Tax=Prochlorococcus sp. MIT 1300 TaxID=3096218 RepID=UPI002A749E0B|nr:tRNA (adenosine(37)-N6)-dimethylallyltransferase MiaA [Prochlorococcus sp. MIT 1300]